MLILHLSVVLLLIIVNGFFAMAEIALVSARNARLRALVEAGSAGAQAAIELKEDPSRLLSTVQIGITLIAVLSGTFGEATLGDRRERDLVFLADSRRARTQTVGAPPSRTPRRRACPDHAIACEGGSADRVVPQRPDRFGASSP